MSQETRQQISEGAAAVITCVMMFMMGYFVHWVFDNSDVNESCTTYCRQQEKKWNSLHSIELGCTCK